MSVKSIFIVDGYNVIHRQPELSRSLDQSLESARENLLRCCRRWLDARRDVDTFHVVFDGDASVEHRHDTWGRGIRVLYATRKGKADQAILDLVADLYRRASVTVVTDDTDVRSKAKLLEANVLSVSGFMEVLSRTPARLGKRSPGAPSKTGLSGAEERAITEDLGRTWGL